MANHSSARHKSPPSAPAAKKTPETSPAGHVAAFDRLIHERIRLGIVTALSQHESLTFNELKRILDTTDGNISVHARKLEDAKLIECTKSFEGRVPKTEYCLTDTGRRAFDRYLDHMEALIRAMRPNGNPPESE